MKWFFFYLRNAYNSLGIIKFCTIDLQSFFNQVRDTSVNKQYVSIASRNNNLSHTSQPDADFVKRAFDRSVLEMIRLFSASAFNYSLFPEWADDANLPEVWKGPASVKS